MPNTSSMTPQCWIQMQISADEVASNHDLLIQILLCLPIKSLLRFKSVSKPWLHLISSTDFAKTYTLKNPAPSVSALFSYQNVPKADGLYLAFLKIADYDFYQNVAQNTDLFLTYLSLNNSHRSSFGPVLVSNFLKISQDAKNINILSSCNGLLLLSCSSSIDGSNLNIASDDVYYLVCNPTTKLVSAPLPSPLEIKTPGSYLEAMAFAFDPAEESSVHYRVLCVWSYDYVNFAFKIYSSENGSWRTCPETYANIPLGVTFEKGVYWKGSIHYLNEVGGHDSVYFSLRQDETLRSLSMPPLQDLGGIGLKREWYWGQSGDHLWLVENHANVIIDVYNLKTDYSGWEMLYQIHLPEIGSAVMEFAPQIVSGQPSQCWGYALSVVVRKDNDEDVFEIVCKLPGAIVAYDPKNHTAKLLWDFYDVRNEGVRMFGSVDGSWIETLAPV